MWRMRMKEGLGPTSERTEGEQEWAPRKEGSQVEGRADAGTQTRDAQPPPVGPERQLRCQGRHEEGEQLSRWPQGHDTCPSSSDRRIHPPPGWLTQHRAWQGTPHQGLAYSEPKSNPLTWAHSPPARTWGMKEKAVLAKEVKEQASDSSQAPVFWLHSRPQHSWGLPRPPALAGWLVNLAWLSWGCWVGWPSTSRSLQEPQATNRPRFQAF